MATVTMLTGTKTKEVSVVDRAANNRVFAIHKSEDNKMDILDAVIGTEAEGEVKAIESLKSSGLSDKAAEAATGLFRLMSAFRDELKSEDVAEIVKSAGFELPTEQVEVEKQEESKVEKIAKAAEELPAELQAVFKEQQEAIEEANERSVELAKALADERDVRLTKEYKEKAGNQFGNLGEVAEVGAILKELHKLEGDVAERVENVFKAAQERIAKGSLLKEIGTEAGSGSDGDSWGRIQKMAAQHVEKSKVSEAEAINLVMKEHPELYNEYLDEKGV